MKEDIKQIEERKEITVLSLEEAEKLQKEGWLLADITMRKTYRFLKADELKLEGK